MRLLLLTAVVLTAAACSQPIADAPSEAPVTDGARFRDEADYLAQRARAVAELDALIGTAAATNASACRTVAVGAKACGGPLEYRVYSATSADAARVEAQAERVTALDRRANAQFEYVSDCMLVTAPETTLREGRCVAR